MFIAWDHGAALLEAVTLKLVPDAIAILTVPVDAPFELLGPPTTAGPRDVGVRVKVGADSGWVSWSGVRMGDGERDVEGVWL